MKELVSKVILEDSLGQKMRENIAARTPVCLASRKEVQKLNELYGVIQFPFVRDSAVAGARHPLRMVSLRVLQLMFATAADRAEGATVRQLGTLFDVRQNLTKGGVKYVRVRHLQDVERECSNAGCTDIKMAFTTKKGCKKYRLKCKHCIAAKNGEPLYGVNTRVLDDVDVETWISAHNISTLYNDTDTVLSVCMVESLTCALISIPLVKAGSL